MANHLTPDELAKDRGTTTEGVLLVCIQERIPVYQGKIDKFLFTAHVEAHGISLPLPEAFVH